MRLSFCPTACCHSLCFYSFPASVRAGSSTSWGFGGTGSQKLLILKFLKTSKLKLKNEKYLTTVHINCIFSFGLFLLLSFHLFRGSNPGPFTLTLSYTLPFGANCIAQADPEFTISPGWPWIHYVVQVAFKLSMLLGSASQSSGITGVCHVQHFLF
jgi:hypothetical protein